VCWANKQSVFDAHLAHGIFLFTIHEWEKRAETRGVSTLFLRERGCGDPLAFLRELQQGGTRMR
jgi:hypothetical protein